MTLAYIIFTVVELICFAILAVHGYCAANRIEELEAKNGDLDRALNIEQSDHLMTKRNLTFLGSRYDTRTQIAEDIQTELTNTRWAMAQAFNALEDYLDS